MQNLQALEVKGQRVLTTKQIADCYETTTDVIKHNFNRNKERYINGKHYISLKGDEKRTFSSLGQIVPSLKYAKILYLWTEKGALLHAKSLNTNKAWEAYDYLVDFYFRAKKELETYVAPQCEMLASDCIEQVLKDAANKACKYQMGQCKGIVSAILESEKGDIGSVVAVYNLLSDNGKKCALELMRGEA